MNCKQTNSIYIKEVFKSISNSKKGKGVVKIKVFLYHLKYETSKYWHL